MYVSQPVIFLRCHWTNDSFNYRGASVQCSCLPISKRLRWWAYTLAFYATFYEIAGHGKDVPVAKGQQNGNYHDNGATVSRMRCFMMIDQLSFDMQKLFTYFFRQTHQLNYSWWTNEAANSWSLFAPSGTWKGSALTMLKGADCANLVCLYLSVPFRKYVLQLDVLAPIWQPYRRLPQQSALAAITSSSFFCPLGTSPLSTFVLLQVPSYIWHTCFVSDIEAISATSMRRGRKVPRNLQKAPSLRDKETSFFNRMRVLKCKFSHMLFFSFYFPPRKPVFSDDC